MDSPSMHATSSSGLAVRKKRSNFHRRPHPDPKTNWQNIPLPSTPNDYGDINVHEGLSSLNHSRSDKNFQDSKESLLQVNQSGSEKKLRKVKLKLGGVTRTLQTTSTPEDLSATELDTKYLGAGDAYDTRQKQEIGGIYKVVYKSNRVSKKRRGDDGLDDEDDEEIRYLKKLQASKASPGQTFRLEGSNRPIQRDYDDELGSDDELNCKKKRLSEDFSLGSGQEMTITTRKRGLGSDSGGLLEFPDGLPPAPSKKQKLPEVQQQLRKAEAAERRRVQAEKAAKEAQAEAIRRILGQDSSRKKKEDKLKKQQEDLAQEKTEKAASLGPSTIRCIMGPQGTVVTFSDDIGLPKIFNCVPCSYPPPREKCVGPNCTNEYKYRDSKSKLPLCSLNCYKAVQGNVELLPAC